MHSEVRASERKQIGALQDYTQHLRMTPFKVEFSGNPAVEIGDFVFLRSGGSINDNFLHYGIVTYHRWVFNGNSEIRCEYGGNSQRPYYLTSGASEVSTFAAAATLSEESITPESVQPKSQLEKRLESTNSNASIEQLEFKTQYGTTILHLSGGQLDFVVDGVWKGKIGDFTGSGDLHITTPQYDIAVSGSEFSVTNTNTGKTIFWTNPNSINFGEHSLSIIGGSWYLDDKKISLS